MVRMLLLTLCLGACATPTRMPLGSDKDVIRAEGPAILLMTATLKNQYHPSYQPKAHFVAVETPDPKGRADRLNFDVDAKGRLETNTVADGNQYFMRLALPPGAYVLRGIVGFSGVFPVRGMFVAPLHADVTSPAAGVYYLGHVEATVRERKEGEFRAGPPLPMIDQAVTGFSGGTFDIEITDRFDDDLPAMMARFPSLQTAMVQKAILGPFDRTKAQQFWQDH